MKQVNLAILILLFLLPLTGVAKDSKSGSSGFKSGFSSQKKQSSYSSNKKASTSNSRASQATPPSNAPASAKVNLSKPASAPENKGATFGRFGQNQASTPVNLQKPTSNLSKDLSKSTANENALRTLDARKQAEAAAKAPPPSPPVPTVTQQAPVIVQQQGNGVMSNPALWFMLGKSANDRPQEQRPNYSGNNGTIDNYPIGNQRTGTPSRSHTESESWGWSLLRIVLWLGIFSVLAGIMYYFIKRKSAAAARTNYTLRDS